MFLSSSRLVALLALISVTFPLAGHSNYLERLFAPKPEPWARWEANDPLDSRVINHSIWDGFLRKYTHLHEDGTVRVAYSNVSGSDKTALNEYLKTLTTIQISSYSRVEQLAYWVNLYNAKTVEIVLDHYPVESIRDIDISPGFFADGPWGKKVMRIENVSVSLNDIEHRILRPIWKDPRIHYAVNCASIGCPNLQPVAFNAKNGQRLLTESAEAYINHSRAVSIEGSTLTVSSIYSWFIGDFRKDGGVMDHLRFYAKPELKEALESFDEPTWYEYDWSLNDLAPTVR